MSGIVLNRIETNSATYEYVQLKVEAIPDSKLHYLPREQCPNPACMDIGQCVYKDKSLMPDRWIHYCHYCHTHYYIRFTDKGILKGRR